MNDLAAAILVLAELLAACHPSEPDVLTGNVTISRTVDEILEWAEPAKPDREPPSEPIFTKVDPDFDGHMAVCGDRIVADVPPPAPPPRTLRREIGRGGNMGGMRLVPLVYTWTPFDPFDDETYDPDLVWLDGEGNYWCAMASGVSK